MHTNIRVVQKKIQCCNVFNIHFLQSLLNVKIFMIKFKIFCFTYF